MNAAFRASQESCQLSQSSEYLYTQALFSAMTNNIKVSQTHTDVLLSRSDSNNLINSTNLKVLLLSASEEWEDAMLTGNAYWVPCMSFALDGHNIDDQEAVLCSPLRRRLDLLK